MKQSQVTPRRSLCPPSPMADWGVNSTDRFSLNRDGTLDYFSCCFIWKSCEHFAFSTKGEILFRGLDMSPADGGSPLVTLEGNKRLCTEILKTLYCRSTND